jgi:hypothetical protein
MLSPISGVGRGQIYRPNASLANLILIDARNYAWQQRGVPPDYRLLASGSLLLASGFWASRILFLSALSF